MAKRANDVWANDVWPNIGQNESTERLLRTTVEIVTLKRHTNSVCDWLVFPARASLVGKGG